MGIGRKKFLGPGGPRPPPVPDRAKLGGHGTVHLALIYPFGGGSGLVSQGSQKGGEFQKA